MCVTDQFATSGPFLKLSIPFKGLPDHILSSYTLDTFAHVTYLSVQGCLQSNTTTSKDTIERATTSNNDFKKVVI